MALRNTESVSVSLRRRSAFATISHLDVEQADNERRILVQLAMHCANARRRKSPSPQYSDRMKFVILLLGPNRLSEYS